MRAYRLTVNLKLGLIVFAVLIAVASLAYTSQFVDRLREREQSIITLWAEALAQLGEAQRDENPYRQELLELERLLTAFPATSGPARDTLTAERLAAYRRAVDWAMGMPPPGELNFITNAILVPNAFNIPAIITTNEGEPISWRNLSIPDPEPGEPLAPELRADLDALRDEMDAIHEPISIELTGGAGNQYVHYGESQLIQEVRLYPYIQLAFVSLFILVGYLGFSYVRRSEQSSLWVGMAKEAAHQLGTPISSLMGWTQLLRDADMPAEQQQSAVEEIEKDIDRLRRVASRFSDIGSLPKLEGMRLAPVVEATAEYMRRRMPQRVGSVALAVDVPDDLRAPINAELFEWVVENLLKNALDAMESRGGRIDVRAFREDDRIHVDVQDTGKGIDRRQWKNVFRPGYSTKKRGWGLGLSLAKRIVEDYHGGTLTLESSRVGHGTTFRITLPVSGRGKGAS